MSKEVEELINFINTLLNARLSDKYFINVANNETWLKLSNIKQALQRLAKYEQILGNGRLTDRNYKNTTLDLDSCKPYLRLGQLEDIYEEGT